jgi:biotin transport system substrate-specific component
MIPSPGRRVALVGLFCALTAVGAQIQFPLPFSPVPIVLSNFVALLAGLVLGPRRGATSQLVYVLLGAVGVPVFAGFRGGPQILVGPTGGYLVGFVLAAAITGALGERPAGFSRAAAAAAAGAVVIYITGVPWLALTVGIPLQRAVVLGVAPFLPGDAVKVVVAGMLAPALVRAVRAEGAREHASGE